MIGNHSFLHLARHSLDGVIGTYCLLFFPAFTLVADQKFSSSLIRLGTNSTDQVARSDTFFPDFFSANILPLLINKKKNFFFLI
jgi:hypothetical protein